MAGSGMWVPAIVTYRIISMPDFPTCRSEQGAGSDTASCDSNRTFVRLTTCVFHNSTSHALAEMIILDGIHYRHNDYKLSGIVPFDVLLIE